MLITAENFNTINRSKSWLLRYYDAVKSGVININGEDVKLIVGYELHCILDNLIEDLQSGEYIYDTSHSDDLIDFMENCIRLTKSPFYNKPMTVMLWQGAWLEALYSFKMYDNDLKKYVDRFTETLLLIARKNTKSETSSGLCLSEMCIGGEGLDIVCASNTYDQANILYEAIDVMRILIDSNNADTWRNREGLKCNYNNNKIKKMSDRTKGKEGRNIDIAVVDEVHEMKDDALVKPIEQSMSIKENKKLILITTEGFINGGYLDEKLEKVRKIIRKEDNSIASKRILAWLYTQDSEQEVWNVNEDGINPAWQKSNPTLIYGIKKWSYLRDQVDNARKSKSDRMYVLSKDFNFKVNNAQAWLDRSDYDYISEFDLENFRGSMCLGAVDLAETTDMTNIKIALIRKDDKRKYILSHYFIPASKLEESDDSTAGAKYLEWAKAGYITIVDGNDIDLSVVADWCYDLQKKYGIRIYRLGYDQRFKQDFIKRMEYYGWVDKEDLIMITQSSDIMHTANRQVEADLKDRLIVGLNEVDKWCLSNSALKIDSKGKSLIVKIGGQASKRIDGAVCLAILQETFNRYKTDLLDLM